MLLECKEDTIYIIDEQQILKARHKSQLRDWGFQKENKKHYIKDKLNVLPRVIQYFNKIGIDYTLSQSTQIILNGIKGASHHFATLVEKAREFKNGALDKADFTQHVDFLRRNLPRKLLQHQLKASYHQWILGNAANFSVPGAGKTTVVLSVYERLRQSNKVNTLFVIGPPACFGPWKNEFKFTLGRKPEITILAGGHRVQRKSEYYKSTNTSELYLTTFQTLANDYLELKTLLTSIHVKAMLVIDEAHYIKQINGIWAKAVLSIAELVEFRCVLTGTPMPHSYSDLYNLFEFLWPESDLLTANTKAHLRVFEEIGDRDAASSLLSEKISPLFYRVRKTELGLDKQVFKVIDNIQMNPIERKLYLAIAKNIKHYATDDYLKNIEIVERLRKGRMIRIRQCLSYAGLLNSAIENYDEDLVLGNNNLMRLIHHYDKGEVPAKIEKLISLVKKFGDRNEKVVIWAHFIDSLKLIERHLLSAGIRSKMIIGATPIERTTLQDEDTREQIREEFVDTESGLDTLLANPAACAESISLHKTCHNAIYYDLSYNCAQFLQSLDRIHRVGGSENQKAYYYFLQYGNTVEPLIYANLIEKAEKMYEIIEGDYNIYTLDMFEEIDDVSLYEALVPQL